MIHQDRLSADLRKADNFRQNVIKAFSKTLGIGSKVTHRADGKTGIIIGVAEHTYDWKVLFDSEDPSMCYAMNLRPEWWPYPEGWLHRL